jgi:16S rRNA processing protein RimM
MQDEEARGLAEGSAGPRFLVVGQIIKPHGLRGEVGVDAHTDSLERFNWLETVFLGEDNPVEVAIESVRIHKSRVLIKLAGYDSRQEAELLRSQWLLIPEEEAIPLDEGEYYLHQIIGIEVTSEDGTFIGKVTDILETKANNVFIVDGPFGEVLLPDIQDVVKEVDLENAQMIVHLLDGLLP